MSELTHEDAKIPDWPTLNIGDEATIPAWWAGNRPIKVCVTARMKYFDGVIVREARGDGPPRVYPAHPQRNSVPVRIFA